ncbi:MAG TPA: methyltransferase domain-containing protein [Vicinamibacteria bacterium]|nr:methyltransferase domain-containing protein [Vicinamibacteria bacterium]
MRTDVREVFSAAASAYGRGNALLAIEREETPRLLPHLEGRDVLDLGCGHGHYARLARTLGARRVVALDFALPMAAAAPPPAVVGDASRLPLASGSVDVVVAALLVSFASDPAALLLEAARVLRPGAALVLSDLHPAASARGWRRSFQDAQGRTHVIDAPPRTVPELRGWLEQAGLRLQECREPRVDRRLEPEFRRAGRTDFARLEGTPLLVTMRAVKGNPQ